MITKYKASWSKYSGADIETILCLRETEYFVIYRLDGDYEYERRVAKMAENQCFFDTWEEAHSWLRERADRLQDSAARELQRAERILSSVVQMVKPEGGA